MCTIIEFPQSQTARVERFKEILDKKKKVNKTISSQQEQKTPPKQPAIINTRLTLQITGISELTKVLENNNDTTKYVTDCIYDLTCSINALKKGILWVGVVFNILLVGIIIRLALGK